MLTPGRVYRLRTATLGILSEDDGARRIAVTLPADSVLTVASAKAESDRMIDVLWEGRQIRMFVIDLRERGETVDSANA